MILKLSNRCGIELAGAPAADPPLWIAAFAGITWIMRE